MRRNKEIRTGVRTKSGRTEEDGDDVIVEGLVVEEELGQQAQVLAVQPVLPAIHLKIRDIEKVSDTKAKTKFLKQKSVWKI